MLEWSIRADEPTSITCYLSALSGRTAAQLLQVKSKIITELQKQSAARCRR